jgi:acyl dehydratase
MQIIPFSKLSEFVNRDLGASPWLEITQERVNHFADATGDHQWIHVDVERAQPAGGTIAHGFLTLSLIPHLCGQIVRYTEIVRTLNSGVNRVRFPASLRVGNSIRAHLKILAVEPRAGGLQVTSEITVEAMGEERPVCVAETVGILYGAERQVSNS